MTADLTARSNPMVILNLYLAAEAALNPHDIKKNINY